MTFETLGLSEKLLKAIQESGYTEPTPIQAAAIPEALSGRDVLGIAQTGTGKTASFTLPMIERLSKGRPRARMPRSLVLAPTRELAAQVSENFEKYGKYHKLSMALLIGGVSFGDQEAKLTRGVDVLIATPGRLLDHFERGRLLMTGIEVMVVDEADRMLDMGFIPDIERIFKLTPMTRQTLFFSATMAPEIQRITDTFLHKPARVEVSKPAQTADTITQNIIRVPSKDERIKRMMLRKLLDGDDVKNGIIFCNRKSTVDIVAKSLQTHGYSARPIHGDLTQSFRMETLAKFREDEVRFLVASDVAARGLDIPDVSHVFNYDVPIHADDYVHRIGRTGRAGRKGTALMLVLDKDKKAYSAILSVIGSKGIDELICPKRSKRRKKKRKSAALKKVLEIVVQKTDVHEMAVQKTAAPETGVQEMGDLAAIIIPPLIDKEDGIIARMHLTMISLTMRKSLISKKITRARTQRLQIVQDAIRRARRENLAKSLTINLLSV